MPVNELPPVPMARRLGFTAYALGRLITERRFPYRSPEALERAQRRRVRRAVAHAFKHVPYYREECRRLGLEPDQFRAAADLAKLPLLERERFQQDPEYFVSDARPLDAYMSFRSSGTAGVPVNVFLGPRELVDQACVGFRRHDTHELLEFTPRRLLTRSDSDRSSGYLAMLLPPESNTVTFSREVRRALIAIRKLPTERSEGARLISMSKDPADALEAINEFKPRVLLSYGSYIEAMFTHAVRNGRPFHRPELIAYGGDMLSPGTRKMLMEGLGIEVLSSYQAIETPPLGFECRRHRGFHLNVDVCPVRIVDDEGRELPSGESGDIVTSDLTSRVTVLLNYRLGDIAAISSERCDCGRNLPLLSYLEGRREEFVRGRDGRVIHGQLVDRPVAGDDEVWGYQVVERGPGDFAVSLLPARGADGEAVRARVRERFTSMVGPEESVEISLVESLPRTPAGKVKRVVPAGDPDRTAPK